MSKEFEQYHGIALTRLVHSIDGLSLKLYPSKGNSSYVLNDRIGLYIKHSKKRMSPWIFTFLKAHQVELRQMKTQYDEVFVIFVCNDDGVCCISYSELKQILDENYDDAENVSISRNRHEKYKVRGKNGKLKWKVADGDLIKKISIAIKEDSKK